MPVDAPLPEHGGQAAIVPQGTIGLPLVLVPGYCRFPDLRGTVRENLFPTLAYSGLQAGPDHALTVLLIESAPWLAHRSMRTP